MMLKITKFLLQVRSQGERCASSGGAGAGLRRDASVRGGQLPHLRHRLELQGLPH